MIWLGGLWFTIFTSVVMLLAIREFYQINSTQDSAPMLWLGWIATLGIVMMYDNSVALVDNYLIISIIGFVLVGMTVKSSVINGSSTMPAGAMKLPQIVILP